jgi:hypothetical protein
MRRVNKRSWAAVAAAAALLVPTAPGVGQNLDCARLRAQIVSAGRDDPTRATSYQRAAARQQAEIERTTAYSRQLGCDRQQFLFFGSAAPPQCGQINAQITRMQSNLQFLQQAAAQAGGGSDDSRRDLIQRYNTYCGAGAQVATANPPRERGFFERLFGGDDLPAQQPDTQQVPLEPERSVRPPEQDEGGEARGGAKAVCVRSCDGGFFPVSYSAHISNLDDLEQLCHALCPNADVNVFTYSVSREIETAVSIDGTSYRDLPNAFLYSKKFDPACTCRPPGKSWAQTLVDAERMLGSVKTDVIVTQAKSDEMSRPGATSVKGRPTKTAKNAPPPKPEAPPVAGDDPTVAESAAAAQVATASKESAGINTGTIKSGAVYGANDGVTKDMVGPDGVTRKVRIIAPNL